MSWTLTPLTERVQRLRQITATRCLKYALQDKQDTYRVLYAEPGSHRNTAPCKGHAEIFEKLPIRIGSDEVIVGNQSAKYRAGALYPEDCVSFIKDEGRLRYNPYKKDNPDDIR